MRPTQLQRKAALIEYWLEKRGEAPGQDGKKKSDRNQKIPSIGMTYGNLMNWKTGQTQNPNKLAAVWLAIKQTLSLDIPDNLIQQDGKVMALGLALGLTRDECRYAVDRMTGEIMPTFSIFSLDEFKAQSFIERHRGLYLVYRPEETDRVKQYTGHDSTVVTMPLSIRYGLPGQKALSRNFRRIRCKLAIPSYRLKSDVHEYDGHVTASDEARIHYWMLEKRDEFERDLVFMMTGEFERTRVDDDPKNDRIFALGTMLSRTQELHSRPYIWPIAVEWIESLPEVGMEPHEGEIDREKAFMDREALLKKHETLDALVKAKLEEARPFLTNFNQM